MNLFDKIINGRSMPESKKKVLVTGGVAFILLLFVSGLLALTENHDEEPTATAESQSETEQVASQQQIPSSQRYDFAQDTSDTGLESLLDAPNSASQKQQNYGVNNDPFANIHGGHIEQGSQPPMPEAHASLPQEQNTPAQEQQAYGPAPIPTAEPATAPTYTLYCDFFKSAQEAESQKAVLAFQGLSTTVVATKEGTFRLKLGPYADSATARATFSQLGERGLVNECSLLTE